MNSHEAEAPGNIDLQQPADQLALGVRVLAWEREVAWRRGDGETGRWQTAGTTASDCKAPISIRSASDQHPISTGTSPDRV